MIFAFMLAHRNFAENVSWKRVKNGFAKAVLRRNALEMLIGFVLVLLLVLELRTMPGTIHRVCWSSNFSLSEKTG
jgi:hypothetical protein